MKKRPIFSTLLASFCYRGLQVFGSPKGTRILCYHRVNDEKKDYLSVPVAQFRAQMKFLSEQGYHTVSLSELLAGKVDDKSVVITFDDGYLDNYEQAFPVMREYGFKGTIFLIAQKIGEDSFLKLSQIEEMGKANFEFGSHTLSHPRLITLTREQKLHELGDSKFVLEKLLGRPCDTFCYPFGQYDSETVNLVRGVGYQAACSNLPGVNAGVPDPYLLQRTEIAGHDAVRDFELKMAGAYDLLHKMLHTLRGRP